MDTRTLADMVDRKARRIEREVADLRRIAAQLRDTVTDTETAETEDTDHE